MIQFEELRLRLLESEKPLQELASAVGLVEMQQELETLEAQTTDEAFWGDLAGSQKVLQRIAMLKNKIGERYCFLNKDSRTVSAQNTAFTWLSLCRV